MLPVGFYVFLHFLFCCICANGQYTLTGPSSAPEGSTVTFTCTTSPVQAGIDWKETSGSNTNSYIYFYNSGTGRCQRATGSPPSDYTFDCNSTGVFTLSFPADYSRHRGAVIQCRTAGGGEESNSITLSVTGVSVPLTSVTLLNATSSPQTVEQDTDATLVCETNPTDPESNIFWRRDGQSVSQGVTSSTRQETGGVVTVSVWSQRVQWTDRGTYSCEALNTGVTRTSQDLTLNVQGQYTLTAPSSAQEGSTVTFTCTTSPVQSAVSWRETSGSDDNEFLYFYNAGRCQRSAGSPPSDYTLDCNSTGVFTMSFPADYSRHNGSVFTCRSSFGLKQSNNITLIVIGQYTLTGPSSAPEGSTVTFTCTTSPVQIGVVWRETSGYTTNIYDYFYNSGTGRCQKTAGSPPSDYTFDCNSTGAFSLSFLADYSRHKRAVFQCLRYAGIHESSIIILSVTGPPETPLYFRALNSTTDSVTLTRTPQYAGGDYTQEFHVEFRVQNTSGDWISRVFPHSQDNFGVGVVDGLDSNTGYVFRIKSVTDRKTGNNQSPVSEEIYFRTKESPRRTEPSSLGVGAVIGIGISGICLLIALVVVGVMVLLKRQEQNTEFEGK